jgi:cation-transporting ATPase E
VADSPRLQDQGTTSKIWPALSGLSDAEVTRRHARGEDNRVALPTSRPYTQIIRENVFSFVNTILFGLGIALVALGRPGDALVSVGVVLANSLVGVVQEVRAKRTLDRIALLTRPKATVIREGRDRVVDPDEVVRDDVVVIRPGDQVVTDGSVIDARGLDVDESLLTGEARPVPKRPGDHVYAGSFGLAGEGAYKTTGVGQARFASQITRGARAFRREYTPLQREINLIVRVVLLVAVMLEVLLVVDATFSGTPIVETVRRSVVVIGLVPNGLALAIAIAYGAGALRVLGLGILVQQANAIEALSHVDVLCLDKTGTLTTGQQHVSELRAIEVSPEELGARLGAYAASVSTPNRTIQAIARFCPGRPRAVRAEVPFSSARGWSALAFADANQPGTYVLGGWERLRPSFSPETAIHLEETVAQWAEQGRRVLVLARGADALTDETGLAALPLHLRPLGLVGLSEEIRAGARETLDAFAAVGIQIKIISGDSPGTVAALARQIGLDGSAPTVPGTELGEADPANLETLAEKATIFGRITPEQKRALIRALRRRHDVAMIGDGVNDVLALKEANLGIVLGSGASAARAVAGLVLLDNAFASLPRIFQEGQRIQNGMQDILKLFLTRVLYVALLLVATGIVGEFPLGPKHNALLTLITVGIPSVALAAWARPGRPNRDVPFRSLLHFVLPAALTLTPVALGIHLYSYLTTEEVIRAANSSIGDAVVQTQAIAVAQTAVTTLGIVCGLMLLVFVEPPAEVFVGGDALSGDWRPTYLALALLVGYVGILVIPGLAHTFDIAPLALADYLLIGIFAVVWAVVLRWVWRVRLMERFLDLESE